MSKEAADASSLVEGIQKLSLGSTDRTDALQKELERTPFTIFEPKTDLGYFGWRPRGSYHSIGNVSADDIRGMMELDARPDPLVNLSIVRQRLPLTFASLPAQKHLNKFPYDVPYIAVLHVASQRQDCDLKTLDFVLGGSALDVLANHESGDAKYIAFQAPSTNVILVRKHKEYEQNFADPGFQLERLVTGKGMSDQHAMLFVEHLHVCRVDKFSVLFTAEVDAEQDGLPVEIKANNPRYWGTKLFFQMLSSGSTMLCHGQKGRGQLTKVTTKRLSQVGKSAVTTSSHAAVLEKRILSGLTSIKDGMAAFEPGTVVELRFRGGGQLELSPLKGMVDLLSDEAINELLGLGGT